MSLRGDLSESHLASDGAFEKTFRTQLTEIPNGFLLHPTMHVRPMSEGQNHDPEALPEGREGYQS